MPYASWTPAQRMEVIERYLRRIAESESDITKEQNYLAGSEFRRGLSLIFRKSS